MATRFVLRYKSGGELEITHTPSGGGPGPTFRRQFERFLETGKQDERSFEFRERTDNTANSNVKLTVDFRELSSVIEYDLG